MNPLSHCWQDSPSAANIESTGEPMQLITFQCKIGPGADVPLPCLLCCLRVKIEFAAKIPVLRLHADTGAGTVLSRRITALVTHLTVFTWHISANNKFNL